MRRVVLTVLQEKEIARGRFVRVGPAMQSVLVGKVDGAWKAYLNVCAHRELPLDLGASSPMSDDGEYLLCGQHGAPLRAGGRAVRGGAVRGGAVEDAGGEGRGRGELEVEE